MNAVLTALESGWTGEETHFTLIMKKSTWHILWVGKLRDRAVK